MIAPALARLPAKTALPMKSRKPGASGRKKPIRIEPRQVRRRKTAFTATPATPRATLAACRLPYQRTAKAAIAAAIGMARLPVLASLSPDSGRLRGGGLLRVHGLGRRPLKLWAERCGQGSRPEDAGSPIE